MVLLTSAFAAFSFAEKMCDKGDPSVESSRGENSDFDWWGAGSEADSDKSSLDGATGIMMEDDYFLVRVVRRLLLRKGKWLFGGDVGGEVRLGEVGPRAAKGAHRYQPKS